MDYGIVKKDLNEVGWKVAAHIDAMLAYWDKDLVCRFANNAYLEWFGKTPEQMINKVTIDELLGPILYEKNLPYIKEALNGEKQVFEREIPLPTGGSRHSIATYYPDIANGKVKGFFVLVADVTSVKILEEKLRDIEKSKRIEVINTIMKTQESERENVAFQLRDNVSQILAYCKMMVQSENSKHPDNLLLNEITQNIQKAIYELNFLSKNLSPSLVKDIGLIAGLEDYIKNFQKHYDCTIDFRCDNPEIEKLATADKFYVFRILQNVLILIGTHAASKRISIFLYFKTYQLFMRLLFDDFQFSLPKFGLVFNDIQNRIEYYNGTLKESKEEKMYVLTIDLTVK